MNRSHIGPGRSAASQGGRWLADVAPQLLSEPVRDAVVRAKAFASVRVQMGYCTAAGVRERIAALASEASSNAA